jgi:outer membrane lipoprotein SlyB
MRNFNILTVTLVSTFALQGCAGGMNGMGGMDNNGYGNYPTQSPQYNNYGQQQGQNSQTGVITNVRQVSMQNNQAALPIGAVLGAAAGGALGNTMGKGNGRIAATVAGAALGGYAGNLIQEQQQGATQSGLEITVRLYTGRTIVVTQAANQHFNIGDRVSVLTDNNGASYVSR